MKDTFAMCYMFHAVMISTPGTVCFVCEWRSSSRPNDMTKFMRDMVDGARKRILLRNITHTEHYSYQRNKNRYDAEQHFMYLLVTATVAIVYIFIVGNMNM